MRLTIPNSAALRQIPPPRTCPSGLIRTGTCPSGLIRGGGRFESRGFTFIEVIITTFIIGTVVTGLFGLFVLSLRGAQETERRVAAIALANERMEMVRNLPYTNVGTSGGVPAGDILQQETVTRNNVPYTVSTDIRYIDDAYDGEAGGGSEGRSTICHQPPGNPGGQQTFSLPDESVPAHVGHGDTLGPCLGDPDPGGDDLVNTDYKQVRVAVSWPSPNNARPVLLITYIVPEGIEGGADNGTLDFQALDSSGQGVSGANLRMVNSSITSPFDLTTPTDSNGRVVLPDLEASIETYELTLTKSGYTSEQTYDQTSTFVPDTDHSHLTMIVREVTKKTFFIDQVASLTITTQDDTQTATAIPNVAFRLRGAKTIGEDDLANPVYKVDTNDTTNASGQASYTDMEWDLYEFTIDGVATGYDIKETSLLLPLTINPADTVTLTVTLVPHTAISLQVTVADENGAPVDNASLQLTGNGHDTTLVTGVLGQVIFEDLPINGSYNLDVSASGLDPLSQSVEVTDTTQITVALTPI